MIPLCDLLSLAAQAVPNKICLGAALSIYKFYKRTHALAQYLAKILNGTVSKAKGEYFVLSIYSLISLHSLAKRINGKFRTPKLEALHRLIHWLNEQNKFEKLDLLPLDNSNLNLNAWLAGFSDCDSNFLISCNTSNLGIAKNIHLTYRLSQRQEYHRTSSTGISYLNVLTAIAIAFLIKPTLYERERINPKTKQSYCCARKRVFSNC